MKSRTSAQPASRCQTAKQRWFVVVVSLVSATSLAVGQRTIEVDDHRPLHAAVAALESMVGYPINYEDAPVEFADDIEDVSTPEARAAQPGYWLPVPRRGKLSHTLPADYQSLDLPTLTLTVAGLVSAYNSGGLPGHFRAFEEKAMVTVMADSVRNRQGVNTTVHSPMSAVISGAAEELSLLEALAKCADLITAATGQRVYPGAAPLLPWPKVRFDVAQGTARDIFRQINSQLPGYAMSYQLLYQPEYGFMLNTRLVSLRKTQLQSPQTEVPASNKEPGSRFFTRCPSTPKEN